MNRILITCTVICMVASFANAQESAPEPEKVSIKVNMSKTIGPMKPVNGIGQPPLHGKVDTKYFKYLTEAGIPFSRLHDVGGGYGGFVFVDIPNVFRDFDADENDPNNYDFTFTDRLIDGLVKHGVKPFYRLGVTIENYANIKAYRVFPPKDFDKWARICEHVIAHYNEGWADGFHSGIEYWEVWNEAELGIYMWAGSYAEYIRLYVTTAKHLKSKYPQIKIGGPASCGLHALTGDKTGPSIRRLQCARDFLRSVKKENAPLDFFSFHSYSPLNEVLDQIAAARKLLDEEGFPGMELCLDEWQTDCIGRDVGTAKQAAILGASLLAFQDSELGSAAIYDGRASSSAGAYAPLFDDWGPRKAYYAYRSFHELRRLENSVEATSSMKDVYVGAAAKDGTVAVMIANTTDKSLPYELDIGCALPPNCRITDRDRNFKDVKLPGELPPYSVIVVSVSNNNGK